LKKYLQTEAGQNKSAKHDAKYIDTINQVFGLLKINYHNQFYKAYGTDDEFVSVRRLWIQSLQRFPPEKILKAAKSVIESSEFLPTLRTMIRHCDEQSNEGLPDAHSAYLEACRAPSPKANQEWSHLAVYYAGKQCDWFFLQSNNEETAFPVFRKAYDKICQKVLQGEALASPVKASLPEKTGQALNKKENLGHLNSLKRNLNL